MSPAKLSPKIDNFAGDAAMMEVSNLKKNGGLTHEKLCMTCLAVCLVLTALTAVPGVMAAEAEETEAQETVQIIDLSGYGDEELVQLLAQVQQEIMARNIEKTASLPAGMYVFGRDVPTGKYLLKKDSEEKSGLVQLAAADDPEDQYPSKLYTFVGREEEWETYITGEEGDVLKMDFPCELTISAGIQFR